ncbi:dihydrodipicolinate synthase family protein [Paenibacillus sp. GCM10023248]|uniref:dihydrodipicolinate synthase family protein n=1 Tax=unclassified Paenibacillus TaxID=185978 RepID=UPI002378D66F|nr:dihydrodipicolinate synthase family protein [Paenibacillus sp. MAHUQ-63]MDD9269577.1 dihydrodipicolinate synthase family protein [Paenibacillus sp. MAHUQ-63]
MGKEIINGVWSTMITPFNEKNEIDYPALGDLVEWYIAHGVDGLFAVCLSSEMFYLSRQERSELTQFIVDKASGRLPVIASGHVSDSHEEQVEEILAIAAAGADAVVLVTNRLAREDESDHVWKANLERLLEKLPRDISLGFYECPYPYKRELSPALLEWCAGTERFLFLKDTSCSLPLIKAKLKAVEGSQLKIFNANATTLLDSLKAGAAGFSGIMANFHPELYVWLCRNWFTQPVEAQRLMNFIGMASSHEGQPYPINAKYFMSLDGVGIGLYSRSRKFEDLNETGKQMVEQFYAVSKEYSEQYK